MPRPTKRRRGDSTSSNSGPSGAKREEREEEGREEMVMKNGLEVEIRTGDIFNNEAEVIAFSVDERLHGPIRTAAEKRFGKAAIDAAVDAASKAHQRKAFQGEILPLDVSGCSGFKYILLVVHPESAHLRMAYRSILQFMISKSLKVVAFPGLGCGATGLTPQVSSNKLLDVVMEWPNGGFKAFPQKALVIDRVDDTIAAFKLTFGLSPRPRLRVNANSSAEEIVRAATGRAYQIDDIDCPICMCSLREEGGEEVVQMNKCPHQLHYQCFVSYLKSTPRRSCVICNKYFCAPLGNMPEGRMTSQVIDASIPGYPQAEGVIQIDYYFHDGVQSAQHLRPGTPYSGTHRRAYLPNVEEGRKVQRLLEKAFECKLTFTVNDSVTSGLKNTVVWNNVHHKTSLTGGSAHFGYPDPEYLGRLTSELAQLGVTEDLLD